MLIQPLSLPLAMIRIKGVHAVWFTPRPRRRSTAPIFFTQGLTAASRVARGHVTSSQTGDFRTHHPPPLRPVGLRPDQFGHGMCAKSKLTRIMYGQYARTLHLCSFSNKSWTARLACASA